MIIQFSPMGFCDISAHNIQTIHVSMSLYSQTTYAYHVIVAVIALGIIGHNKSNTRRILMLIIIYASST